MTALGQKQTSGAQANVRFVPIADMGLYASATVSRLRNRVVRQKGEQRPGLVPT
jgi:hypothetical protein